MKKNRKLYFASDFHLGAPDLEKSRTREDKIVRWLNMVANDATDIFLLGDIFDFWFEYKTVVPKGFVRLLGKLAELSDSGINIHIFKGNHDMWMKEYFNTEFNAIIHTDILNLEVDEKKLHIGHGDGLGPGDKGYKFIKKVFRSRINQWFFRWLHPDLGIRLADFFSSRSRAKTGKEENIFFKEKEWLIIYSKEILEKEHFDYFIFGHRHLPVFYNLNETSSYINLGDMITHNSYAVFSNGKLELKYFEKDT
jgi:UDP-2,3-diacylglucosamine hydrolase